MNNTKANFSLPGNKHRRMRRVCAVLLAAFTMVCAIVFPGCSDIPDAESGQTCTMLIECGTILQNIDMLDPDKLSVLPPDGIILEKTTVRFNDGETVFDVLCRETRNRQIHMESSYTPVYNSAYIEGINNLYEFDCGEGSGWVYSVNGVYPNYGCSGYKVQPGDSIEWHYTCNYGKDVGAEITG